MLDVAYGIPIAVNCIRGRKMLPERSFVLPNVVGWIANLVRLTGKLLIREILTCFLDRSR